jgi:hypothetical protein
MGQRRPAYYIRRRKFNMRPTIEVPADLVLTFGAHTTREEGMCAMEAVAWLAGEKHSAAPACACRIITRFVQQLDNGISNDETRTRLLKPLLPKLIGTRANSAVEKQRAFIAADFAVREAAPLALEALGLRHKAASLSSLLPIVDERTAYIAAVGVDTAHVTTAASSANPVYYAAASAICAVHAIDYTPLAAVVTQATIASYAAYASAVSADAALCAIEVADDERRGIVYELAAACILRMCAVT